MENLSGFSDVIEIYNLADSREVENLRMLISGKVGDVLGQSYYRGIYFFKLANVEQAAITISKFNNFEYMDRK